ncbi:MAG: hypothetical protein A4E73_00344 [Syntrophaceae bacterium PtaU1.Bin231]|nr:MAG: hypothetical protein A4E73_00344 [Syntrophaceae bacterium PtaU1.Bin231]
MQDGDVQGLRDAGYELLEGSRIHEIGYVPPQNDVAAGKELLERRVHAEDVQFIVEQENAVGCGAEDLVRASFRETSHVGDAHLGFRHAENHGDGLFPAAVVTAGPAVELLFGVLLAGACQDLLDLLFRNVARRWAAVVPGEGGLQEIAFDGVGSDRDGRAFRSVFDDLLPAFEEVLAGVYAGTVDAPLAAEQGFDEGVPRVFSDTVQEFANALGAVDAQKAEVQSVVVEAGRLDETTGQRVQLRIVDRFFVEVALLAHGQVNVLLLKPGVEFLEGEDAIHDAGNVRPVQFRFFGHTGADEDDLGVLAEFFFEEPGVRHHRGCDGEQVVDELGFVLLDVVYQGGTRRGYVGLCRIRFGEPL